MLVLDGMQDFGVVRPIIDILFVIVSNFSVITMFVDSADIKLNLPLGLVLAQFSSAIMQMKDSLMSWFLSTIALLYQAGRLK